MDRAIIDECVSRTKEILETEWDEISSMKDENDGRIKISAAYLVSYKGNEQAVKTTVTFGRKVSESRESIINPDQLDLPMEGNGQEPGQDELSAGEAESMAAGKKTRRTARQKA